MEAQGPTSPNHEFRSVETMQVKRRINQFFGSILRKDKTQLEQDQEEPLPSSQTKNKQKNRNNQSYSQWDLMEHIAVEPTEDDSTGRRNVNEENMIYSDGLAYYTEETLEELNEAHLPMAENNGKKNRSFLKRSGSLLRKSLRRSKKKSKNEESDGGTKWQGIEPSESLSNIVQEINTTIFEVATFTERGNDQENCSGQVQRVTKNSDAPIENDPFCANEIFVENSLPIHWQQIESENEWTLPEKKVGLKNGLKRQASKLASKFQRAPGSMRLKSTVSIESFPHTNRSRSASFSTNAIIAPNDPVLKDDVAHKRMGSFKRKLSFKEQQAKKVVRSGVTSFGKSMMHYSSVMPISYESPPVTFYPDYDNDLDGYPQHLVQCYYRTISYQQKPSDCSNSSNNDKAGQQSAHCARPTSFYQHDYCYNG